MTTKQNTKNPLMTRSHAVKVGLTPATYEKLTFVSETLGMAPSAVAALAVSEYVALKCIAFGATQATQEKMIEAMAPQIASLFQNIADKEIE